MKTKQIVATVMCGFFLIFHNACRETVDAPVSNINTKTFSNLPADTIIGNGQYGPYGAGKYTYFQFDSGIIIPPYDTNTTRWDIAFQAAQIKVNGNTSGPGIGGIFLYKSTVNNGFNALLAIPNNSVFKTDNGNTLAISPYDWCNYDKVISGQGATLLIPNPNTIFCIRTAKGKYVKMEILSYYKDKIDLDPLADFSNASLALKTQKQRYYTFRYVYQGNGTKVF